MDTRKLLMTKDEIKAYNENILKYENANVVDLSKAPSHVEAAKIVGLIEKYNFGNYQYINGTCFQEEQKQKLRNKRNLKRLECNGLIEVRYALVTTPADVRSFPTTDVLMESQEEWRFDYFQESKLSVGEGVCIFHQTEDEQWYFVQSKNYAGWIQKKWVHLCTRETMLQKLRERNYLPYTTANVMKQALKFLHTPYRWGNKGNGLDCSGVVLAIYEAFGFSLPRNTSAMAACKDLLMDVSQMDSHAKKLRLKTVLPGSLLLMNGHVVMYLGMDTKSKGENVYAFHSFSKYFDENGNLVEVMACAITTMDLKRSDGSTFLDGVHSVWELLPDHKEDTHVQGMYF